MINNGGATSGGSTVLCSRRHFRLITMWLSSFQLGLPLPPPGVLLLLHLTSLLLFARFSHYHSIANPPRIGFSLLLPNPYTQSAPVWTVTPALYFLSKTRAKGWLVAYPLGMSISFSTRFYTWQSSQLFITFITFSPNAR